LTIFILKYIPIPFMVKFWNSHFCDVKVKKKWKIYKMTSKILLKSKKSSMNFPRTRMQTIVECGKYDIERDRESDI